MQCPEVESNRRHEDFQSSALPTELSGLNTPFIIPFSSQIGKFIFLKSVPNFMGIHSIFFVNINEIRVQQSLQKIT